MHILLGIDTQPNRPIVSFVFRERGLIVVDNLHPPPFLTHGLREKIYFRYSQFSSQIASK